MASLRKTIRKFYYDNLQRKYANNRSDLSFDWKWSAIPFNRIALLNLLVSTKQPCRYLEIGCDSDIVFKSVPAASKTGVDPVRGGTIRKTSDEFFRENRESYDVVYIDGLHAYEQVRRDVVNALACVNPEGWVVLHDMLPHNWLEGHCPRITPGSWTGDVWKVAYELAETVGVEFKIVKIDNGCGVIRASETRASLSDRFEEMKDAKFAFLYEHLAELALIDWDEFRRWARV